MTVKVILITGSNMGDREALLAAAAEAVGERVGEIVARSAVAESEPWGEMAADEDGAGDFLNQVLVVETTLTPGELLDATQEIERELGRERKKDFCNRVRRRYRPRTMDVDILYYGDAVIDTPRLAVPHPLMAERAFVLRPLAEAAPGWRHPVTGLTADEMLAALEKEK